MKTVGHLSERERFKRRAGHSARESALELLHAEAPGPLDVPEQELAEAGWETSRSFSEVPAWLLDKDRWDVKRSGKWQFAEGIYELESRALVMSLSRIACSKRGRDIRQLLLVDNMAVALSFERHRSKNFSVLKAIRRFGSLCLARNISTCIRWVPSEANAADKPSRHPGGLTETPAQSEASAPPDPLQGGAASARQGQAAAHAKGVGRPHGNLVELYLENHTLRHNDAPCRRGPTPAAEAVQSRQREHVFFDHRVRRDQGKKAERTSATQAKATTPPQVPRPGYGRPPSGYHFPQGTSSHLQGPEVLPQGGGSVQGVRQAEISSDQTQRADRRGPCSVPEPPFLVGKPATPGRQASRRTAPCLPRVWKVWEPQGAPDMAGAQRVASAVPGPEQETVSSGGLGRRGVGASETRLRQDGGVCAGGPVKLLEAFGAPAMHSLLAGSPASEHPQRVELAAFARAGRAPVQDWRVRHVAHLGLSVPQAMGPCRVPGLKEAARLHAVMGFQLRRVRQGVQTGCRSLAPRPRAVAVPDAALRTQHRSRPQPSLTARSAAQRNLEKPKVSPAIREVSQTRSRILGAAPTPPSSLSAMRRTSRGCYPRQMDSTGASLTAKHRTRYHLDLFSGKGGVSKALRRLGFRSFEFDTIHGADYDLSIKISP